MKKYILLATIFCSLSSYAIGQSIVRIGISNTGSTPYVRLEGEYELPLIGINDKLRLSSGLGLSSNIAAKEGIPMYYAIYLNPTIDYILNKDTMFKTGLSLGAGLEIVNIYDNNLSFTIPALVTFETQYKNFSMNLKLGVRNKVFNGAISIGYIFN